MILVLCWAVTVYRRIYNAVNDDEPAFAVSCIAVITKSLYGFCNFVAYFAMLSYQRKKFKDWSPRNAFQSKTEMQAISQQEEDLSDPDDDPCSVNVAVISNHN